jgi:hypothetical protein
MAVVLEIESQKITASEKNQPVHVRRNYTLTQRTKYVGGAVDIV